MLGTAALLRSQPLPTGSRVAVVTNAGGAGVLAADACVEAGLTVPELPADLAAGLAAVLPEGASAGNPVDITAEAGDAALEACLDRLTANGAVDAVLVVLVPTAPDDPAAPANRAAWTRLSTLDIPFLVAFSDGDPITGEMAPVLKRAMAGAAGLDHPTIRGAGHFLQEDAGERLGEVIVDFVAASGSV